MQPGDFLPQTLSQARTMRIECWIPSKLTWIGGPGGASHDIGRFADRCPLVIQKKGFRYRHASCLCDFQQGKFLGTAVALRDP